MIHNGSKRRAGSDASRGRGNFLLRIASISLITVLASYASAQSGPHAISLPSFRTNLESVQIEIPRKAYVAFDSEKQLVRIRLTADLSDLRQKLSALALASRVDVCVTPGADTEISKVDNSLVNLKGDQVWFDIAGTASRWSCVENPVPNSKVTWALMNVAPGIVTKVPEVSNSPGAPIKTTLERDIPFSVPFGISISWTSFGVDTKYTNIPSDTFTEIPKLANQMAYITNPILAHSSILAQTLSYKFSIDRAAFFSDGLRLSSLIDLSAHVGLSDYQKIEALLETSNN